MAYEVSGTTPEGLVSGSLDRQGAAIVLPDAELSPDKVLWHAVQQEDQERKRSQAASRQALSELNNIKVNGWANHLTELNQQKNDLLDKASSYLQKYRGKNWNEFDPRNKQQAQEALDIQSRLSQLKEMENFSEQVKQWHQLDTNAYKGKENNFDTDSITQNTDFYKKPLTEAYKDFSSTGERPMLEQAYPDWQPEMIGTAKKLASDYVKTVTDKNGMIIGQSYKGVPQDASEANFETYLTTPKGQYGLKQLEKNGYKGTEAINQAKKIWDSALGTSSTSSATPDALGKKKEAAQWESSGNTIKNDKNIFSVYRKENGDTEVTLSHTDPADNKPLTFAIGNDNPIPVTGTPIKIVQSKDKTPELYISVPKGYDYKQLTTKDEKVHLVQTGKDSDILRVPYDDFSDVIKNEFGSGELSYYDVLARVKGKTGSVGQGGGKSEHKASSVSSANDYLSKYGIK